MSSIGIDWNPSKPDTGPPLCIWNIHSSEASSTLPVGMETSLVKNITSSDKMLYECFHFQFEILPKIVSLNIIRFSFVVKIFFVHRKIFYVNIIL